MTFRLQWDRGPRRAGVLGAWAAAALAVLGAGAAAGVAGSPAQEPGFEKRLRGIPIEIYARHGDWESVLREARTIGAIAAQGSDEWFAMQRWIVVAHEKRGEWEALERVARAALALEARALGAPPWAQGREPRPLGPVAAGSLFDVRFALARALQAQELHGEALGHLRLLVGVTHSGRTLDVTLESVAGVGFESGRSLLALGRWDEARGALETVRAAFPEESPAMLAALLLGVIPGNEDVYQGVFEKDPRLARARADLRPALGRARERLARLLDVPSADVPQVLVGFADATPATRRMRAFTNCDPRRPGLPPMIVLTSAAFASGSGDLESTLVHELAHAWAWTSLGVAHESLPAWLAEGLAQAIAGELDSHAWMLVGSLLAEEPHESLAGGDWEEARIDFGSDRPGLRPTDPGSLLALPLAEAADGEGARRFVEEMQRGSSWSAALEAVTGMEFRAYRRAAEERAKAELRERWHVAVPRLLELHAARRAGSEDLHYVSQRLLRQELDPVSEGHALVARAEALELNGRIKDAETAWDELTLSGPRHALHFDRARLSRAACLASLRRTDEAEALYAFVSRTAATPAALAEAARGLARLRESRDAR